MICARVARRERAAGARGTRKVCARVVREQAGVALESMRRMRVERGVRTKGARMARGEGAKGARDVRGGRAGCEECAWDEKHAGN